MTPRKLTTDNSPPAWAGSLNRYTRGLVARLRQVEDQGGFDGHTTDPLHMAAADRIVALETALLTERELYNAWFKRANEAEEELRLMRRRQRRKA